MKHLPALAFLVLLSTTPAMAVDTVQPVDQPDVDGIRAKISAGDYRGAIDELKGLIDRGVLNADVYNLLGYSLRKSGDLRSALTFYRKALDFEPNHRGALEYSGELYLQMGDLDHARRNVSLLQQICPQGCEELTDLQRSIDRASMKMK